MDKRLSASGDFVPDPTTGSGPGARWGFAMVHSRQILDQSLMNNDSNTPEQAGVWCENN